MFHCCPRGLPPPFPPFAYTQPCLPGLIFSAGLSRYVSPAAAAAAAAVAAKLRSGFWERARKRCTGHARWGPGPGDSRTQVTRGGAASDQLPHSQHFSGFSSPADPPSALASLRTACWPHRAGPPAGCVLTCGGRRSDPAPGPRM